MNSTATVCEDMSPKFFTLLAGVEQIFLIAGIMVLTVNRVKNVFIMYFQTAKKARIDK